MVTKPRRGSLSCRWTSIEISSLISWLTRSSRLLCTGFAFPLRACAFYRKAARPGRAARAGVPPTLLYLSARLACGCASPSHSPPRSGRPRWAAADASLLIRSARLRLRLAKPLPPCARRFPRGALRSQDLHVDVGDPAVDVILDVVHGLGDHLVGVAGVTGHAGQGQGRALPHVVMIHLRDRDLEAPPQGVLEPLQRVPLALEGPDVRQVQLDGADRHPRPRHWSTPLQRTGDLFGGEDLDHVVGRDPLDALDADAAL